MGPGIRLYAFGPFLLDTRERRLLRDGEVVPLTLKAFDLLQVLVENQGHLLQKEELLRRVWPDAIVEENNLTVTISALRKALGEGPTEGQYIETVPRRGYRFVADFRASAESTEAVRSPQERRARAFALRAMVLAALAAVAALAWVWKRSTPAATAVPVRSMAVLPFRSLTNDGEYLGLGMADALITRLGSTKQLLVRSTGSVQKYTGPGLDPVAVGRDLQVDSVLEGSIQTDGDRLRTTVRLLRVGDGSTLWAGTFDERLTDIFAVQDSISQRMAGALALELTEAQRSLLTRRDTGDSEAYQLYLKGRFFWNKRSRDGFERGAAHFRQAVEKDPAYALAYSGLADSYIGMTYYLYAAPHTAMPLARAAALKALHIDGSLAEAHVSLAHVKTNYEWDWAEAERLFRKAIELEPEYDAKYHYPSWRPLHAIRRADTDGNPLTEPDPTWQPLRPTPNHPEYPSAHACHTTAIAVALESFFGTKAVSFSLDSLVTGETRYYDRFKDVVQEVNRARVWAGFHFRNSDQEGSTLGRKVGRFVVKNFFQPLE